jgi:outer membrane autotransporter protein
LNFWFKAQHDFGERRTTPSFTGFKFGTFGVTGGVDYRLSDAWVSGLAFTYQRKNANLTNNRGDTDSDAFSGAFYSSYYLSEGLHLDALASYGGLSYETTRNAATAGQIATLTGTPGARQYSLSAGGGYEFHYQAATFEPYARADYIGLDVEGFRERGGALAVKFGQQHIHSLTSALGARAAMSFSFPWGVLTPQAHGEWRRQFMDGRRTIQARFVSDPTGSMIKLSNDTADHDFYSVGAELAGTFANGLSGFLAYETLLGSRNTDSHSLLLGGRLEY